MKNYIITILSVICALCLTSNPLIAAPPAPIMDYQYFDSDKDGLDFDMIDISSTGTRIAGAGDDWYGTVGLPFVFPFFQSNYGTAYLSSNGFITFSTSGASYYSNVAIPNSNIPNNMIAAMWDDLYVHNDGGSGIYYRYFTNLGHSQFNGPAFVIMWNNVSHLWDTSYRFDFEIILFPNGDILMQYGQDYLDCPELSFTTGIEAWTGTTGLQYAYNDLRDFERTFAILFTEGNPQFGPGEVDEIPDWDELYGEVLYENYDKLPTHEVYTKDDDKVLGIECFITAAGQSGTLFPLIIAAITAGGVLLRKRFTR